MGKVTEERIGDWGSGVWLNGSGDGGREKGRGMLGRDGRRAEGRVGEDKSFF